MKCSSPWSSWTLGLSTLGLSTLGLSTLGLSTLGLSTLGLLFVLTAGGCEEWLTTDPEVNVQSMADAWPPYRAPAPPVPTERSPIDLAAQQRPRAPQSPRRPRLATVRPREEWDLRETAIDSLGRIGPSAVPALMRALRHPNPAHRAQAAGVLARIGPAARRAVPELIQALRDPELEVRKSAARALGQMGSAAHSAVEPLMEIIERSPGPAD